MNTVWYKTEKGKKYSREYNQKYRDNNRLKIREYNKKYYQQTKLKRRLSSKKSTDKIRPMLFDILGHVCKYCGFSDKRALQFDHINGGGNKEVKQFKSNTKMIRFYIKNPDFAKQNLQVLCANCNWIKKHENKEVTENTLIY